MKLKIIIIAFISLIGFQSHSQLAYDVLELETFVYSKTQKATLDSSISMVTSSPTTFAINKSDKDEIAKPLKAEHKNTPLYLSSIYFENPPAPKKLDANTTPLNSLMLTFYSAPNTILAEWLKPIDYDFQNLQSIPNIPKGFGPLFKF